MPTTILQALQNYTSENRNALRESIRTELTLSTNMGKLAALLDAFIEANHDKLEDSDRAAELSRLQSLKQMTMRLNRATAQMAAILGSMLQLIRESSDVPTFQKALQELQAKYQLLMGEYKELISYFVIYQNNLIAYVNFVESAENKKKYNKTFTDVERELELPEKISSYLIMPVQRLPRHQLFFKRDGDLVKAVGAELARLKAVDTVETDLVEETVATTKEDCRDEAYREVFEPFLDTVKTAATDVNQRQRELETAYFQYHLRTELVIPAGQTAFYEKIASELEHYSIFKLDVDRNRLSSERAKFIIKVESNDAISLAKFEIECRALLKILKARGVPISSLSGLKPGKKFRDKTEENIRNDLDKKIKAKAESEMATPLREAIDAENSSRASKSKAELDKRGLASFKKRFAKTYMQAHGARIKREIQIAEALQQLMTTALAEEIATSDHSLSADEVKKFERKFKAESLSAVREEYGPDADGDSSKLYQLIIDNSVQALSEKFSAAQTASVVAMIDHDEALKNVLDQIEKMKATTTSPYSAAYTYTSIAMEDKAKYYQDIKTINQLTSETELLENSLSSPQPHEEYEDHPSRLAVYQRQLAELERIAEEYRELGQTYSDLPVVDTTFVEDTLDEPVINARYTKLLVTPVLADELARNLLTNLSKLASHISSSSSEDDQALLRFINDVIQRIDESPTKVFMTKDTMLQTLLTPGSAAKLQSAHQELLGKYKLLLQQEHLVEKNGAQLQQKLKTARQQLQSARLAAEGQRRQAEDEGYREHLLETLRQQQADPESLAEVGRLGSYDLAQRYFTQPYQEEIDRLTQIITAAEEALRPIVVEIFKITSPYTTASDVESYPLQTLTESITAHVKFLIETIAEVKNEKESLQRKVDELSPKVEELNQQILSLKKEHETTLGLINEQLQHAKQSRDKLISQISEELQPKIKEQEATIESLQKSKEELIGQHTVNLSALQHKLDEATTQKNEAADELASLTPRLKELEETLSQALAGKKEAEQSHHLVAAELAKLKATMALASESSPTSAPMPTENTEAMQALQQRVKELEQQLKEKTVWYEELSELRIENSRLKFKQKVLEKNKTSGATNPLAKRVEELEQLLESAKETIAELQKGNAKANVEDIKAVSQLAQQLLEDVNKRDKGGKKSQQYENIIGALTAPELTVKQLTTLAEKLCIITCAYRKQRFGLFQANYAETKSSDLLVDLIKDGSEEFSKELSTRLVRLLNIDASSDISIRSDMKSLRHRYAGVRNNNVSFENIDELNNITDYAAPAA